LHATGRRLTLSFAWIVACAVALVVAAPAPAPAQTTAGVAYFPNTRAPVQIAREVNLQRAAQAGVVKLESKGGGEGDAVSLEVTGKQIPGDVTVTVRAEFTVPDRLDEENRAAVRDGLAGIAATFGGGFDVGAKSNELPGTRAWRGCWRSTPRSSRA
jgi:hypothetical protein